jgi:SAM-dependent methyltransferase
LTRRTFPLKRLADGRALVNLGSSARVAPGWNNVDSSWLLRLARHPRLSSALHRVGIVSECRYERLRRLDPDAVCWDLKLGIPFSDASVDVVYHSHVLEHLDRQDAPGFLCECLRVLKPGGILRVVVPDLEQLARRYLDAATLLPGGATAAEHAAAVDEIFDQMVLCIPRERAEKPALVRLLETVFVGDTRRSGTMHRWMYDRHSLGRLLEEAGFVGMETLDAATSRVPGWTGFLLDTEPDGSPYKPGSLYVEARRPDGDLRLRRGSPGPRPGRARARRAGARPRTRAL